jgi:hypothetical protein
MPPKADPYAAPLHRRIDTFLWIFSVILAAVVFLPRRAVARPRASYPFSVLSFSASGVRCSILDTGFTIHGSRGPVVP